MDQLTCAAGVEGAALLIDCRDMTIEVTPLPPHVTVIVMDTGTRRALGDSEYNARRHECNAAAEALGAGSLRDVQLDEIASIANPVLRRRARHVVSESLRARETACALSVRDVVRAGSVMNASHASLRDDFEVSGSELDEIVDLAVGRPECFGARMTGGGFGGCAVALVERENVQAFVRAVGRDYLTHTGINPVLMPSHGANGVSSESFG
jgi:galactokinase